jgi:pimeloyl-ACP methyl ester carboxylesterase
MQAGNGTQLLLVHGGFHGPWVWQGVLDNLAPLGLQVETVELPSVAAKGEPRYGMLDDAAEVRRRLESIDGPVVVVAHSYGGLVVTEAAAGLANVRHIVYLAGFALDIGESLLGTVAEPPPWWNIDGDTLIADSAVETFYHDVPAGEADRAVARLRPSSYSTVTERLTAAAWREIPSTYVICDQDHAIAPSVQEHLARRSTNVRRLPTSHSPMLSRPAEVAQIVAEVMSLA